MKLKTASLLLSLFFFGTNGHAQDLSASDEAALVKLEKEYSSENYTPTLGDAWLCYRSSNKMNHAKADTILMRVLSMQDSDPESKTYGHWGWVVRDGEKFVDFNNALFQAHILFCNLWVQQGKMTSAAQTNFILSCRGVLEAARRRWDTEVFDIGRDYAAYSNVFAMYVQTLTLAGDRFNDPLLKRTARSQWIRWHNHISFYGIDEFASPVYNNVIFNSLMDIHDYCHDEQTQKETKEVMDHLYMLQSAVTHPLLKIPVSGISRDYRIFLKEADARSHFLTAPLDGYKPPQDAVAINENRTYPFEVIGRAALNPFIFKSYQLEDAAMGSMTGGNCFQQQIHCMAAVGKNENERAIAFIQGSNTPVNGYTDQIETSTLCVYNRFPTYWHLTQKHSDMATYRETFGEFGVGISKNWQEKSAAADHIVLEAYGYDLHIFPFAVKEGCIVPCNLALKHRDSSSPRYHPRPIIFDEYVFPAEPDWFGVYVTLAKSGTKVDKPRIKYANKNGVHTFTTRHGHLLKLFIAEKGDTKQLFNVDPAIIPLLKISK
jgi:hypothetical protein